MKKIIILSSMLFLFSFNSLFAQIEVCGTKDFQPQENIIPSLKDTGNSRGTMDVSKTWSTGSTLRIKFLNGDTTQKRMVKQYATEWTKYANLFFEFIETGLADIRIRFDSTKGNHSAVGTDAMNESNNSINFDITANTTEKIAKKHILHEFGHALGLLHEQSSPINKINWNLDTVYAFYKKEMKWSMKEVDENVLHTYGYTFTNGEYDARSIMHYYIRPFFTKENKAVGGNYELSDGDKKLIAALYPKDSSQPQQDQTPKVPYTIVPNLDIEKGILVIKPNFELQNGNGYSFKLVTYFFDEKDKPLQDIAKSEKRSQDGQLVSFTKLQPCCKSINFNTSKQNPMQLTMPISNLQLKKGNNNLKYKIIIWSGNNSIYKSPMYSLALTH